MTVKIILHQTAKGTNKNAQKQNRLCSRKPQIIFQYSVLVNRRICFASVYVYTKCCVTAVRLSLCSHIILYAACVCSVGVVMKCLLSSQFSQFRMTIKVCVL